MIYNRKRK